MTICDICNKQVKQSSETKTIKVFNPVGAVINVYDVHGLCYSSLRTWMANMREKSGQQYKSIEEIREKANG